MDRNQKQYLEDLRRASLEILAERAGIPYAAEAVARRIRQRKLVDGEATPEEVRAACDFLVSAGLATLTPDPLGSTAYFQATSQGILQYERSI